MKTLSLRLALSLAGIGALAGTAHAQETPLPAAPVVLEPVEKTDDKPWLYNAETKKKHLLPEVDGKTITVTKKNSVSQLDDQPSNPEANLRETFARLPGLLISDQQTPTQANLSYRGLGNPQESEFVLSLQDGIPIESDLIGFPTLYYIPQPQTLSSVQLIRGGSSLLYGPEPAPAVNFVTSRPALGEGLKARTENTGGSNGLFSTYNEVSKGWDRWDAKGDFYHRVSDGPRLDADYELNGGDAHAGYRTAGGTGIAFDLHSYHIDGGDPGRMSYTQYRSDRNTTPTPNNRFWVDRTTGVLTLDTPFAEHASATTKLWFGNQDLDHRTSNTPATTSTIERQDYTYEGLDSRLRYDWGRGNALTVGTTLYTSNSPFIRYDQSPALADRDASVGRQSINEDRRTLYAAGFTEAVFRLPYRIHIVPSARFEHEEIKIGETVNRRRAALGVPLVNTTYKRDVPLFGLGIGNDFGKGNETYASVSQGYRPLRYYDVSGPFNTNNPLLNQPDPQKSVSYELGVHGWPKKGLYYDVSLFQVNFTDRIETQQINATDSISVNTGDTRHRGIEAETSLDLLAFMLPTSAQHLELYANASLLNATFTDSRTPTQIGKTPAYSPHYLARAGVIWRQDEHFKLALNAQTVGKAFWQDSNAAVGAPGAANYVPAEIPTYTVVDLSGDYTIIRHVRLLGGVNNLLNRDYYARVFGNGLEPALKRTYYAGAAFDL